MRSNISFQCQSNTDSLEICRFDFSDVLSFDLFPARVIRKGLPEGEATAPLHNQLEPSCRAG